MSRGAIKPQGKRLRLTLAHRTADHPTLLSAWGRVRGGELGLVLRSDTGVGVLVSTTGGKKTPETRVWRCDGALTAPGRPTDALGEVAALELLKGAMKPEPAEGTTTLRGQWTGVFVWDQEAQLGRVELTRRLSTYGVLTIASTPELGWSWAFHRKQKWFTEAGDAHGEGFASLDEAVTAGIAGAQGLIAPACTVRDTSRRAALDTDYASRHPLRAPSPTRDRLAERVTQAPAPAATSPVTGEAWDPSMTDDKVLPTRGESRYAYGRRLLMEASSHTTHGHPHRARELLRVVGRIAPQMSASKASRLYERITYIEGRLAEESANSTDPPVAAATQPTVAKPKAKRKTGGSRASKASGAAGRGRRTSTRAKARRSAPPTVDTDKDEQLLSLFQDAISNALGGR